MGPADHAAIVRVATALAAIVESAAIVEIAATAAASTAIAWRGRPKSNSKS